jgi:hypothetical protein
MSGTMGQNCLFQAAGRPNNRFWSRWGLGGSLPRLRPQQRHTARPDAPVEYRARYQPGSSYPAATAASTPHAPQYFAHRALRAVEARQFRDGKSSFAGAVGRQAVHRQVEASQLMERTSQDCGPLPTGGGIGGHTRNIKGTR